MAEKSNAALNGKYELGRVLGNGTFAKVYHARDLQSGKSIAMKIIRKEKVIKAGMMEQVKREIAVMKMVSHPNIVELHEVMASKTKIYFALELVRGGELFAKVAKGRLRDDVARSYFQQMISAVDFCHSRGVYHRDLKPENLMLDGSGNLKVADFGLSALQADSLKPDGLLHTSCGTPAYVAPEVLRKKGYDGAKADIWSCGVILYVMLAGFLPFQDENLVAMYKKIYRGDFKCPPWFSPEARRLITKMLDPNPNTRITVSKIIESSWFKKSVPKGPAADVEETNKTCPKEETMNAFHIIALSQGLDLSPLFYEERKPAEEGGEMRFATGWRVSQVITRLEEVAANAAGKFSVTRSRDGAGVRLQGEVAGRKGRLAITAEVFMMAESFSVVEVKRTSGDTLEYDRFCCDELRPGLKDILWTSSEIIPTSV